MTQIVPQILKNFAKVAKLATSDHTVNTNLAFSISLLRS